MRLIVTAEQGSTVHFGFAADHQEDAEADCLADILIKMRHRPKEIFNLGRLL